MSFITRFPEKADTDFDSALVTLHRYELRQSGDSYNLSSEESPPQSILALRVLALMFRGILNNLPKSPAAVLQTPPFEIHTLYLSIVLHLQVGDRSNFVEWKNELETYMAYLRITKKKWSIAGKCSRSVRMPVPLLTLLVNQRTT